MLAMISYITLLLVSLFEFTLYLFFILIFLGNLLLYIFFRCSLLLFSLLFSSLLQSKKLILTYCQKAEEHHRQNTHCNVCTPF